MRPADNIKKTIKKLNITASPELHDRLLDNLLKTMQESTKQPSATTEPNIWRTIMKNKITKFAAAAMIISVLFLIFYQGESSLYGQVIESMRKASTIHCLGYAPQDGEMQRAYEIWYKRDVGLRMASKHRGKERVMVDDGNSRWTYEQGNDFVVRNRSMGIDDLPREITEPSRYLDKCVKDSTGDMIVDGFSCALYVGSYPNKADSTRLMYWIDQERRLRRFEERVLQNGIWKTVELNTVEYDVDLDHWVFQPDFGDDVEVDVAELLDLPELLETHFSLDNAIFTKEEMGLVFTVHELKRCQDDLIFAVTSLRPTEQTLKEIKSKDPRAWNYGGYQFGSCFERNDGTGNTSYGPIELAWIYHGGLKVTWTVFDPWGFEAGQVSQCKFELYLSTEGKLALKRKEAGLPNRKRFKPIVTLPLPAEKVNLENQIRKVYNIVRLLEPIVSEKHLTLKSIPFTDEEMEEEVKRFPSDGTAKLWKEGLKDSARLSHGQSQSPSNISEYDWAEDRLKYIEEIQRQ